MKEREKPILAVDDKGLLVETGKQISVDDDKELVVVPVTPQNGWIFLQPLTMKELKTPGGIILSEAKAEFRAAVVAVGKDSGYKRGQVINLDPQMLPQELKKPYYICDVPVVKVPEHLIIAVYNDLDLSTWKKEEVTSSN